MSSPCYESNYEVRLPTKLSSSFEKLGKSRPVEHPEFSFTLEELDALKERRNTHLQNILHEGVYAASNDIGLDSSFEKPELKVHNQGKCRPSDHPGFPFTLEELEALKERKILRLRSALHEGLYAIFTDTVLMDKLLALSVESLTERFPSALKTAFEDIQGTTS